MTRIFIEARLSAGELAPLRPDQVHYLGSVLRLSTDDSVTLVDEAGVEFRGKIAVKKGKEIALVVVEETGRRPGPSLPIRLFVGLMKGNKMERLVRDAAALGVESVTPFISSRTIPKDIGDMKLERAKKIAREESRLVGRNLPLLVNSPVTFADAVRCGGDLSLFLWEEETRDIRRVVGQRSAAPPGVWLFTGPEGGFSAREAALAVEAGLVSVSLGRRIIRAEVAPLVAAAVIQYEWGDL